MNPRKATIILNAPLSDSYKVSYVRSAAFSDAAPLIKNQIMKLEELHCFLNKDIQPPILICEVSPWHPLGQYSFIDENGNPRKRSIGSKPFRETGLLYLRQFCEDAASHAIHGTGQFEVYPLNEQHLVSGEISHYFSRGNTIVKEIANCDLRNFGISRLVRRGRYDDQYGNPLPQYSYSLQYNLLLLRHITD